MRWTVALREAKSSLCTTTGPSPIRQAEDAGPVRGARNMDLICGHSAQRAELTISANPGSRVSFQWTGNGDANVRTSYAHILAKTPLLKRFQWPYRVGPIITYMTPCGDAPCDKFDPTTSVKWFKIDQVGQDPNGRWYQELVSGGASVDLTIPMNISPGGYLIRHEVRSML